MKKKQTDWKNNSPQARLKREMKSKINLYLLQQNFLSREESMKLFEEKKNEDNKI